MAPTSLEGSPPQATPPDTTKPGAKASTKPGAALFARLRSVHPSSYGRLLWALPVLLAVSYFYVFMASVGTFHDQPWQLDYYDRMVEGFRHGHLHVVEEPSPQLLAKADPFDFGNMDLWLWDASLYKGHYYLYWGPVPALFLWAYKALLGTHERITDQWPTTLFILGRFYAGAALILSLASRVRIRQPPWLSTLAIAAFGLANPIPFIVARPHVYEASLAGGQCFVFAGLFFAFWALEKRANQIALFSAAGLCWALSVGCRATNFVSVPLLVVATACFAAARSDRRVSALVKAGLALGLPVLLAGVGYAAYNQARFDSPWEFGTTYQATRQPFYGYGEYVLPNVFSYLFAPLAWGCRFPFVRIPGDRPLSSLITWPAGYLTFERVSGLLATAWWCGLALLVLWQLFEAVRQRVGPTSALVAASRLTVHEAWLLSCSVAIVLSMIPVLSLWEASMRYVGDAVGGICLSATVSVFWLVRRLHEQRPRWRTWAVRGLVLTAGLQTCLVGALSAFSTTEEPLKNRNPIVYQELQSTFSLCSKGP